MSGGVWAALGGLGGALGDYSAQTGQREQNRYFDLLNAQGGSLSDLQGAMNDTYARQRAGDLQNVFGHGVIGSEADQIARELDELCPSLRDPVTPAVPDPWYVRWYVGVLKWLLKVIPQGTEGGE